MIFSDSDFKIIRTLQSRVRNALASSESDTPFVYEQEDFFRRYEALSRLWQKSESQRKTCAIYKIGRNKLKEIEKSFVTFGAIGLLPDLETVPVDPKLEALSVLAKKARPHENSSYVLKLAGVLAAGATLERIRRAQRSYGFGQRQDTEDAEYFIGLQKILSSISHYKTQKKSSGHDTRNRKKTFVNFDRDPFQHRVELFKTLSGVVKNRQIRPILRKYGISAKKYYALKSRYMFYGIWGLVDLIHVGRRVGEKISAELELKIIEERLMNPMLSAARMIEVLDLKCSKANVQKIYKRWNLSMVKTAVTLRGTIARSVPEKLKPPGVVASSAVSRFPNLVKDANLKTNQSFDRLLKHLRYKSIPICNPGAIIIAPFLAKLGIVEALHTYCSDLNRTTEISNNILLNVIRIVAGYPTINNFMYCVDPSVAIGAGQAEIPRRSRFYESFDELRFSELQKLRNDVSCRAKELGIIEGKEIAIDYHCDPSDSGFPQEKSFSKSPDKNGNVVYAHRPQILWDGTTNSIINIAYSEGRSRAPTALYNFLEKNLFKIIDPGAVREIYADSEYTGHKQLIYLIVRSSSEVTMCLKQNPKIRKWKEETIKKANWEKYGRKYRITSTDYLLPETGKLFRFVVKQNIETGETRCFGSTHSDWSATRILDNYHLRWCVESGIKDLGENYFLNKPPGTSPEKVELHYYCVMIARLVVDYFLSVFCDPKWKKPEEWDCVISTLRASIFCSQSCTLTLHESGDLLITYSLNDRFGIKKKLQNTMKERNEHGLDRVSWWGNRGLRIKTSDEYNFLTGSD